MVRAESLEHLNRNHRDDCPCFICTRKSKEWDYDTWWEMWESYTVNCRNCGLHAGAHGGGPGVNTGRCIATGHTKITVKADEISSYHSEGWANSWFEPLK